MSSSADAAVVRVDTAPFDLPGSGAAAALCLHGLSATPYEVRPLAEALAGAGVRALGPALPGHNATPQELARTTWQQWLECARAQLRTLRGEHERVFAVGLSMGGLLTLDLAADEAIDALVVIGVPLRFHPVVSLAVPLLARVYPFMKKRSGSDIRDPAARARHPSYDVMPLASVRELVRLQRRVRGKLGRIRAPLLVAHGAHDRTASPADARRIIDAVGSADKSLHICADSGHVVPVDYDRADLARAVVGFLGRHL